jgi:hypothetical protein
VSCLVAVSFLWVSALSLASATADSLLNSLCSDPTADIALPLSAWTVPGLRDCRLSLELTLLRPNSRHCPSFERLNCPWPQRLQTLSWTHSAQTQQQTLPFFGVSELSLASATATSTECPIADSLFECLNCLCLSDWRLSLELTLLRLYSHWQLIKSHQSESYVMTGGRSACLSWCQTTIFFFFLEILFRQLRVCYYGVPSLMKGWVCNLRLLLGLTSAIPLGSMFRIAQLYPQALGCQLKAAGPLYIASARTRKRTWLPKIPPLLHCHNAWHLLW